MNKFLSFSIALFALAASAIARDEYAISKVTASTIKTPEINYTGDQRRAPRSQQWIELEVEFQSIVPLTDELTFKYYALIGGKCLTGEVTHVNIAKGRDLRSVMYISPQSINRLLEGKTITPADIQDVGVQMLNKGQLVAEKSYKGQGEWWVRMQQVPGMLINKNETPFAPLYYDRYEAIKPSSR